MNEYFALFVTDDLTALNAKLAEGFNIQNNFLVGDKTLLVLYRWNQPLVLGRESSARITENSAGLADPPVAGDTWSYTIPTQNVRGRR